MLSEKNNVSKKSSGYSMPDGEMEQTEVFMEDESVYDSSLSKQKTSDGTEKKTARKGKKPQKGQSISKAEKKRHLYHSDAEDGIPSFKTRTDDFEDKVPKQTIGLFVLAVLVAVGIVFGIKTAGISAAVLCVIILIELLMGFFLGNAPAWFSLLLEAAMIIIGVVTGTFQAVLIGSIIYAGMIIIIKDR